MDKKNILLGLGGIIAGTMLGSTMSITAADETFKFEGGELKVERNVSTEEVIDVVDVQSSYDSIDEQIAQLRSQCATHEQELIEEKAGYERILDEAAKHGIPTKPKNPRE